MRQLSFIDSAHDLLSKSSTSWFLYTDGASRNNPGPSAAGIYIIKNELPYYQDGYFLGTHTNNQAEYLALIMGLFFLKKFTEIGDRIIIFSDSQLLVHQLNGIYKVKNENLKALFGAATTMMHALNGHIQHIPREKNTHADHMANHALDTKKIVPPSLLNFLNGHEIYI